MTMAVPPEKLDEFATLVDEMGVEITDLGQFTDSGYFHCLYQGKTATYLPMEFIHNGVPQMVLSARWTPPARQEPDFTQPADMDATLRQMLGRLDICSKESVVRRYDHEVQGGTVIKPLVGVSNDGPSDAAVLRPLFDSFEGVVVAHGICPSYSDIDTYHMMANAIDEGLRNYVAVGGNIEHVAGLDNFCWCDPVVSEKTPDGEYKAAQLVRANQALYNYCLAFGVPLISGKDSMKNDYMVGGTKISIPPTVLFSVIGKIEDLRKSVTMDAKAPGDLVYLLGSTHDELGGSEYYAIHEKIGRNVPKVDAKSALQRYRTVNTAQAEGLLASCHDLSDGGLGVALAETAFAGGFGLEADLGKVLTDAAMREDKLLYSESASRLLVTIKPDNQKRFEALFNDQECACVGQVSNDEYLKIVGLQGEVLVHSTIDDLKEAWQSPLREM
jgi:phosphoribosylformylglycinamidine (FGAM) synthase-like enzyme